MFDFLILLVFIVFVAIRFYTECYKKCPPGKAMVVYGKTDNNLQEPVIITEGGIFVIPLIQDYALLPLESMSVKIDTTKNSLEFSDLLTKDGKKINIKATFVICISKQQSLLKRAAGHLLGMLKNDIIQLAKDIILGEIRLDTATLTLEEIYNKQISKNCFRHDAISALENIGMELINIDLEEITDNSGYKESLEMKSEPEKTFNDEFKDLAQKEIENKDSEPKEITTVESPEENTEQEIQKTFDFQKDTQTQIDDIFASTKKYFEQNGNT